MTENAKCTVEAGKHVRPCNALSECVEGPAAFSRSKGIHVWAYTNMSDRLPSRTFYGFKGMHPDHKNGFLINFCPFCGTQIDAPFNDDDEPEASE